LSNSNQDSHQPPHLVLNLDHDLNRLAIREALQLLEELRRLFRDSIPSRSPGATLCLQICLRLQYFLCNSEPHRASPADLRRLSEYQSQLSQALQRSLASDHMGK